MGIEEHRLGQPLFDNDPGFQYTHGSQRYTIKDMESVVGEDKIAIKISQNFAPGGRHYLIIALCNSTGSFAENEVAYKSTMHAPYRWGAFSNKDGPRPQNENGVVLKEVELHPLLVTGMYITFTNPKIMDISVEVKGAWGTKWGDGGYSWVTVNMFEAILIPKMHDDQ